MSSLTGGSTAVSLSPAEAEAEPGETVTFDIVVEEADGSIGAHETVLEIDDTSVATLTDVELFGDPGQEHVDIADDGGSADTAAALMETDDGDSVTIASVDVEIHDDGATDVTVDVETLSDELGQTYTVTETTGATVTTPDEISVEMVGDSLDPGGEADLDVTATGVDTVTVQHLWTDWDVTAEDVEGGETTNTVDDAGTFEISWDEVQSSVSPVVTVDIPSRYTGGTFKLEITATDGTLEVSDTTTIDIT